MVGKDGSEVGERGVEPSGLNAAGVCVSCLCGVSSSKVGVEDSGAGVDGVKPASGASEGAPGLEVGTREIDGLGGGAPPELEVDGSGASVGAPPGPEVGEREMEGVEPSGVGVAAPPGLEAGVGTDGV